MTLAMTRSSSPWDDVATTGQSFSALWANHGGLYSVKLASYLDIYDQWLQPFVGRPITLIEFGVLRGGSLQLWRKFLGPEARIIGVDAESHPDWTQLAGIAETVVGLQQDPSILDHLPEPDIVIDDAGHFAADQIVTFDRLWPRLRPNGLYVVEDLMPRNGPAVGHIINSCFLKWPVHLHKEILIAEKRVELNHKIHAGRGHRDNNL